MSKFSIENETKLAEIETHLTSNAYLSGGALPDGNDADILLKLTSAPEKSKFPNTYFWWVNNKFFSEALLKQWAEKLSAAAKPEAKKKEAADDDLFGSDDDDEAAKKLEELKKKKAEEGAKKKKEVIARSIVIFDVKVFEQEQDLDALAKKIIEIQMEGLQWRTEYKKVPVAYGMYKLQIGCTVEDDKVLTDDIFEKILCWEDEVQSCDIVSFQKV
jgi:elongation factor 1-beta